VEGQDLVEEGTCHGKTPGKTMWRKKPRRGGTSGGMVAHDLVKAAEKVLWIA